MYVVTYQQGVHNVHSTVKIVVRVPGITGGIRMGLLCSASNDKLVCWRVEEEWNGGMGWIAKEEQKEEKRWKSVRDMALFVSRDNGGHYCWDDGGEERFCAMAACDEKDVATKIQRFSQVWSGTK